MTSAARHTEIAPRTAENCSTPTLACTNLCQKGVALARIHMLAIRLFYSDRMVVIILQSRPAHFKLTVLVRIILSDAAALPRT
jgi:hypothetical protein